MRIFFQVVKFLRNPSKVKIQSLLNVLIPGGIHDHCIKAGTTFPPVFHVQYHPGIVYVQDERRWRFGIEYYDGRAQLGEFFQDDERYISIGLWLDL